MNHVKAFNALNVVARTDTIRAFLHRNDKEALAQVDEAIKPVSGSTRVERAARDIAERLENIGANFSSSIGGLFSGHNIHVEVHFNSSTNDAVVTVMFMAGTRVTSIESFCQFCRVFIHPSASTVHVGGSSGQTTVQFLVDEDNA